MQEMIWWQGGVHLLGYFANTSFVKYFSGKILKSGMERIMSISVSVANVFSSL